MRQGEHRYEMLDCLRGIAAIVVVWYHTFDGGSIFPSGALAVDLFFILSGFVIAHSYGEQVIASKKDFLIKRFVRLYPMLFLGALGGIALALIHNVMQPSLSHQYSTILSSGGLSLLSLPYLTPNSLGNSIFSFNPPLWSLFFEITANILYAGLAKRLSARLLILIIFFGLAGVLYFGMLGGNDKSSILAGFPRVFLGFFGGVYLFQLLKMQRLPTLRVPGWSVVALMITLFSKSSGTEGWSILFSYVMLFAIVIAAINVEATGQLAFLKFLGYVSYPVYLMHWITLYLSTYIGAKLGLIGERYIFVALGHLIAIPMLAWLVIRWYETPVRKWLGLLVKRQAAKMCL